MARAKANKARASAARALREAERLFDAMEKVIAEEKAHFMEQELSKETSRCSDAPSAGVRLAQLVRS